MRYDNPSPPPLWRLPEGVNPSLWEYTHTKRLADEEDAYFEGHPLFQADAQALDARFVEPGPLVDLGCGTGRHALRFARRGFPVLAIDLSHAMVKTTLDHARGENHDLPLQGVTANLCRLESIRAGSFAYALSMFSTLGMIRGRTARRRALAEAYRILQPGGRIAIHVHNFWLNLHDSQGRAWLLRQTRLALLRHPSLGDRKMTYRGINAMEVHLFRWPELRSDLKHAGLRIDEVLSIDAIHARPIPFPWLAWSLRAGGWIVFASRPGT